MNIKPLADRVVILPAPAEEKTVGGIIIPDTAKEKAENDAKKDAGAADGDSGGAPDDAGKGGE